jgi:HPt (histidine-containing phosphotransfer) domain-containing protein
MSDPALQDVIAALWAKYEGLTRERLARVELALEYAEKGALTDEMRFDAIAEAHKLAGSLGTFGMADASKAASRIESGLNDLPLEASKLHRMRAFSNRIREAIDRRRNAA